MAKTKVSEWSSTPISNTDIDGINLAEGMLPSDVNNALREMMSQLKNQQAGLDGDNFTVDGSLILNGATSGATTFLPIDAATATITLPSATGTLATLAGSETLTNKTIALGSNTVSGTTAQFNTALTDGDFATLAGSETLTNKALNGSLGATTPSTVVATTISGTTGTFTGGVDKLTTATGVVSVSAATAPSVGQVLQATSATVATWQTPSTVSVGGSNTQLQYNNSSALGGISGVTTDGTRITNATTMSVGGATPSTSGAGITFPATQSASTDANTLDDYEEGTWTPSVGGTATYNSRWGTYTKVGNLVTVMFNVNILLINSGSTTTLSGLPFPINNPTYGNDQSGVLTFFDLLATSVYTLNCRGTNGALTLFFSGTTASAVTITNVVTVFKNGATLQGGITYQTTS